jgi:hypothetical protein
MQEFFGQRPQARFDTAAQFRTRRRDPQGSLRSPPQPMVWRGHRWEPQVTATRARPSARQSRDGGQDGVEHGQPCSLLRGQARSSSPLVPTRRPTGCSASLESRAASSMTDDPVVPNSTWLIQTPLCSRAMVSLASGPSEAAVTFSALTSPELHHLLTVSRGWSQDRGEDPARGAHRWLRRQSSSHLDSPLDSPLGVLARRLPD